MENRKIKSNFTLRIVFSLLLSLVLLPLAAQTIKVSGVVSEATGGIPGVNVTVKGTTVGTITDMEGRYYINVPSDGVLQFTFIGYQTKNVSVKNRTIINVTMEEDSKQLDEVVVVGYGVTKKSDLTGSVASVKADDLNFPSTSVAEMLRGKAAGIQVTASSGRPGSGSEILIRGKRSLSGSSAPLYIVDNSPVSNIDDINPADIESIEILKDASSQAIYGARAANGVIFLTTKRGVAGKVQISYNGSFSTQTLARNFDYATPEEMYDLIWEAKRNSKGYSPEEKTPELVFQNAWYEESWKNKDFLDLEKETIKPALMQKHNLSFRGGNDGLRYAFSLGFLDQDGMIKKSGYKRLNMRSNVDWDMKKWLSLGVNTAYTKIWREQEDGSATGYIEMLPFGKLRNPDGSYTKTLDAEDGDAYNPLYTIDQSAYETLSDRLDITTFLDVKPFKGFNYRLNVSYRSFFQESGSYKTKDYPKAKSNEASLSTNYNNSILVENIFTYNTSFSQKHKLGFTFLQSYDYSLEKSQSQKATGLPTDFFKWNGMGDATDITSIGRGISEGTLISFLGRINYTLLDKYLLTVSMRRDGSSVFGANNKWGNFPSVAGAWKIGEEEFMKPITWISNLKLRVSYGAVGNQGISRYQTLNLANSSAYAFGDDGVVLSGYTPGSQMSNPDLKWESTYSSNFGVDFGFLNQRIYGTVEYYRTKTNDLLVNRNINVISGYSKMWTNLGETKSKGVELTLGADIFRRKDFNWNVSATYSRNRSEIVRVDDRVNEFGAPMDDTANGWYIGYPKDAVREYVFDGIWQLTDDKDGDGLVDFTYDSDGDGIPDMALMKDAEVGSIKIKDMNGDGIITEDDKVITANEPSWIGSLSTSLNFKGFDFFADFYTVQGLIKSNPYLSSVKLRGKSRTMKLNYWTPENPSNEFPRPVYDNDPPYAGLTSWQDASYIRLRTLTVGYTLPKKFTNKFMVDRLRFYFTGSNLLTITDFKSYSPERNANSYPESRQYLFGLNLDF